MCMPLQDDMRACVLVLCGLYRVIFMISLLDLQNQDVASPAEVIELLAIPNILGTAGVQTNSLALLESWTGHVEKELERRLSKKRSFSDIENQSQLPTSSQSEVGAGIARGMSASASAFGEDGDDQLQLVDMNVTTGVGQMMEQSLVLYQPQLERVAHVSDDQARVRALARQQPMELDHVRRSVLESMPQQDLVAFCIRQGAELENRKKQITELKQQRRMDCQRIRRLNARLDGTKEKLQQSKATPITDLEVYRTGSTKLTWRGSISLGIRKALSIVSASSFPQASLLPVSKMTVLRSEVITCAFLIVRTWFFHRIMYALLKQLSEAQQSQGRPVPPPAVQAGMQAHAIVQHNVGEADRENVCKSHDDSICEDVGLPLLGDHIAYRSPMVASATDEMVSTPFSLGATYWCSDATNSSIWKRQKLQGMLATTGIMTNWSALQREEYQNAFTSLRSMWSGCDFGNCVRLSMLSMYTV